MSILSYIKEFAGETIKNISLNIKLNNNEYTIHNNITLEYNNTTTQIDHIIVSKYGVFIIETKKKKIAIKERKNPILKFI